MRRVVLLILVLVFSVPCNAVSTEDLRYSLPSEAAEIIGDMEMSAPDVQKGFGNLLSAAKTAFRSGLKNSVKSAFLMTAACLGVAMVQGYAKSTGTPLPARAGELAGATVILTLALQQNGALLGHCKTAIGQLDTFTKVLTSVFAVTSAAAGRPASAVATAGAAMLFSDVILNLSLNLFLPAITWYLLLSYSGILTENIFWQVLHSAEAGHTQC